MAISRSSAIRMSRERPARFAAIALVVASREPTLSPLRREQHRNAYRARSLLESIAEPTAQACLLR
jgi:hypothetical protein